MRDERKTGLIWLPFIPHPSSFLSGVAPMELEQVESLCARCARQEETCCQSCEVYVTPGDVRRIAAHTGHEDFYGFQPSGDPIYTHHPDDPIWMPRVFRAD